MFKNTLTCLFILWYLLPANTTFAFTHADTLRGSNGPGRDWWDVLHYDLQVTFDTVGRSISGTNLLQFSITKTPADSMQIDLQEPMILDSVILQGTADHPASVALPFSREGNVWWVTYPFHLFKPGALYAVMAWYHGVPRAAVRPPWDGGFTWTHDSTGKLWVAVSCQGLGASVWWPCKDAQWDEPDSGMVTRFYVPGHYAIGNGRALEPGSPELHPTGLSGWEVKNPINTYDVTFYIGDYVHWHDTLMGEKGKLDLDFWALRYNEQRARQQFAVVKEMIHCYEYWLGPYPFYEDGYKLVEAPYLGMEHQGAIAYGNKYMMGYLGMDRSMTGYGKFFDYIIIHESGHEWFGNSITARDIADNWIHEGITSYIESLFAECTMGKEKGMKYCHGAWNNIQNDHPVIGHYGVNEEGPGDMYEKGSAIMYMIRMLVHDDDKFRNILRGLGKDFYHQVVTTRQVEDYISTHAGLDLTPFFNQYLRKADIPVLEYGVKDGQLSFRFNNTDSGFTVPVTITNGDTPVLINPTSEWQHISWSGGYHVKFSRDFLIKIKS